MENGRFPIFIAENRVRGIAALVFLVAVSALVLRSPWFTLFLAIDFATRALLTPKASLIGIISGKLIAPVIRKKRNPVPFRPKRFAAIIGLALSIAGFLFALFEIYIGLYIVIGALAVFSALEAFAGFCAGCKMFAILMRLHIIPLDSCPECENLLERQRAG